MVCSIRSIWLSDYSHSTAILLAFIPDAKLKDIERLGIGLVVCRRGGPLAPISVDQLSRIAMTCWSWRVSYTLTVRMYAMLLSNYSGHMAYATDWPFCVAYPLEFMKKDNPGAMTFPNLDNHPVAFMANAMVIHQLLVRDCLEHEYASTSHGGCLIIPRGTQFGHKLFPEIVIPTNHAAPYSWSHHRTGSSVYDWGLLAQQTHCFQVLP